MRTNQRELFPVDDFTELSDPNEGIEDLQKISAETVSQAVVWSTDWTTETVISQINKGNILLNPRFQRRDAWESQRKSRFIESLILGFPVPPIVLAESKSQRGAYIVIDGKQRLLSIRQFAAKSDDENFQQLKLSGITILSNLRRMSLEDLNNSPDLYSNVAAFENQPIRTVVIKNWPTEDFLYQVFLRLNTGSVPLSPQELRQALHPGAFVEFADEASGESSALRELLRLDKPDFRMRDAELLVRFYAFQYFVDAYRGELKDFMDTACKTLNAQWIETAPQIKQKLLEFEDAYMVARDIFGKQNVCRKWSANGYERPFNRAIFDIIMYYFADPSIRAVASRNGADIEQAFKELCTNNSHFLASIERTTKSIGATSTRLSIWAGELRRITGLDIVSPLVV